MKNIKLYKELTKEEIIKIIKLFYSKNANNNNYLAKNKVPSLSMLGKRRLYFS